METVNLSTANQVYLDKKKDNNATVPKNVAPRQIENGDEKLQKALTALGLIAAVGVTIGCIAKGKDAKKPKIKPDIKPQAAPQVTPQVAKKISDIKFDKGVAKVSDGKNFSGIVEHTLDKGDKITLEYADGALKKLTRTGKQPCEKIYKTNEAGDMIVEITSNGVTEVKNLTAIKKSVKAEQDNLNVLLQNSEISSADFKKQTDEIKFKNKKQANEIEEKFKQLETTELEAARQKELEKLRQEELARTHFIDFGEKTEYQHDLHIYGHSLKDSIEKKRKVFDDNFEEFLRSKKDLSLDTASKLGDYTSKPYDMPLDFMIAAHEAHAKTGSALIVDNIPEMFEGIDSKKISDTMDELGLMLQRGKLNKFEIDGRKFTAEFVGSGQIGQVYKITDETGKSVAIKYFNNPFLTGLQGSFAEIPIVREASRAGLKDAPTFYMANPYSKCITSKESGIGGGVPYGGWHMVEYITDETPLKDSDKGFFEWLRSHGLEFGDYNAGTKKGQYIVDMGGVVANEYAPEFISRDDDVFVDMLLRGYFKGETIDDAISAIQKMKGN